MINEILNSIGLELGLGLHIVLSLTAFTLKISKYHKTIDFINTYQNYFFIFFSLGLCCTIPSIILGLNGKDAIVSIYFILLNTWLISLILFKEHKNKQVI